MPYLTSDDYTRQIAWQDLQDLLTQASTGSGYSASVVQSNAESLAAAEVKMYLSGLFSIDSELLKNSPDATRDQIILMCYIAISVYNIEFTANPRDVPERVEKRYKEAIMTLKGIRDGMLKITVPRVASDANAGSARVNIYSSKKFVSKPFDDPNILQPDQDTTTPYP